MVGLPGSGKSYLLKELSNEKYDIYDEENFYYKCEEIKKINKIYTFIKCLLIFFDVYFLLFCYSIFNSNNKKYSIKNFVAFTKYLPLYSIILKLTNKDKIFDQGIIQYIWSLSFFNNKSNNGFLYYCMKKCARKYNIIIIYYKVPLQIITKRIKSRKVKSDLDKLELNELKRIYSIHLNDYKFFLNKKMKYKIIESKEDFLRWLFYEKG